MLNHSQSGLTLVELLVAITIFGILLAMGVQSYSGWMRNQQVRTGAEAVLNGLQLARAEAVKNNVRVRFVLCALPSSSWEVLAASPASPAPAASLACPGTSDAAAGERRVQERSAQEGSRSVELVTANGANMVTFNALGRVVANTDGSPSLSQIDVTSPGADRSLRITLSTAGSARLCDPSPQLAAGDPRRC